MAPREPVSPRADPDDARLREIRDRYDQALDGWAEARRERSVDLRHISGDPWDPAERKAREAAKRPCLSLDELGQHLNQVVNGVRANPSSPKFDAAGNGATEQSARLYADLWRHIEYTSHAQLAYIGALENALLGGYGFVRIKTAFESDRSFDQILQVEGFPNPDMVLPDPLALKPDSSDMRYCFVAETWPRDEFLREYPHAKIGNFDAYRSVAPAWIRDDTIVLAEYWTITTRERELLLLRHPQTGQTVKIFADEIENMPAGAIVVQRRPVDAPSVTQYLTNGVEILETTPWKGKYIPIVSCYGKVLYTTGGAGATRTILSMTRLARDPYMLYCYYRTQQAEMAGMIPKAPVQGYEGQFADHEDDWARVNREPLAFLEFKGTTAATGAQILPPPSRLDYHAGEHLQALELCAEGARRAIMSACGLEPLPTAAQRRSEKSGVALKHIDEQSQRGSFHFID